MISRLSTEWKPGTRIALVDSARLRGTIVSEEEFAQDVEMSTPNFLSMRVNPVPDDSANTFGEIVLVRWDFSDKCGWHWKSFCRVLPSQELANEVK